MFFGEECGSGYYGNTSGFMVMATLPNTRIQIRIPLILYTMAVARRNWRTEVKNMPRAGFEPAWPYSRDILSVVRMPIPPPGLVFYCDESAAS